MWYSAEEDKLYPILPRKKGVKNIEKFSDDELLNLFGLAKVIEDKPEYDPDLQALDSGQFDKNSLTMTYSVLSLDLKLIKQKKCQELENSKADFMSRNQDLALDMMLNKHIDIPDVAQMEKDLTEWKREIFSYADEKKNDINNSSNPALVTWDFNSISKPDISLAEIYSLI